jgi:hypothetical protein
MDNPPVTIPEPISPPPATPRLQPFVVFLVLLLLAATGLLAYQNWQLNQKLEALTNITPTPRSAEREEPSEASAKGATPTDSTEGWQIYTDSTLGYQLKFPAGWANLQGRCQKILVTKSDAIELELSLTEYVSRKLDSDAKLDEVLNTASERYGVTFGRLPSENVAIIGPINEGELNNIVIRGPEGTGYYDIVVTYVGPVPDTERVCFGDAAEEYKQALSTFRFLP